MGVNAATHSRMCNKTCVILNKDPPIFFILQLQTSPYGQKYVDSPVLIKHLFTNTSTFCFRSDFPGFVLSS